MEALLEMPPKSSYLYETTSNIKSTQSILNQIALTLREIKSPTCPNEYYSRMNQLTAQINTIYSKHFYFNLADIHSYICNQIALLPLREIKSLTCSHHKCKYN
jgi:hypothetical protein